MNVKLLGTFQLARDQVLAISASLQFAIPTWQYESQYTAFRPQYLSFWKSTSIAALLWVRFPLLSYARAERLLAASLRLPVHLDSCSTRMDTNP